METAIGDNAPALIELAKVTVCLVALVWYRMHRKFPAAKVDGLYQLVDKNIVELTILAVGAPAVLPLLF